MTDFRKWAFVGLLSLGLASIGCASNNDNSSGSGGSSGSKGGSNGSGGSSSTGSGGSSSTGSGGSSSTGSGGSSSTGSGGSTSAIACGPAGTGTTTAPPAALITDFSDAVTAGADAGTSAGKITYGTTTTVQGGVTTFQNPASTAGTTAITSGALVFNATVSAAGTGGDMYPYSGVVVYINGPACVDASAYTGVSFSISGDVGTCGLVFSFDDAEHGAASTADPRFVGDSSAYPPQLNIASMVSSTAATIQVPFTDSAFANGSPAFSAGGIDPKGITGVQWQFTNSSTATATCTANITIDNVTFY